ncbi:MAG: nitrous oxide reductase family maturation protein NosD [Oligoflexia bacterium]|nr:nitrous oxide reductase family maturation protein NosD [Oligoflexia bacterium]
MTSKRTLSALLLLAIGIGVGPPSERAYASLPPSSASELAVCPDCAISTLSDAISAIAPGGTIRVGPGVYRENGLEILKPLRLVGDGRPVLDGGGAGTILRVRAPDVEIAGLVVENSGSSAIEDRAGIQVLDSSGCRIRDNELRDNHFGIYLGKTRSCVIENNAITGSGRGESAAGNGIHVWYGQDLLILGNALSGNRDGIYLEFVGDSRIIRNRSIGNFRYGLHFMFSNDDEYDGNLFRGNGSGVAVMYSRNIRMTANRFETSLGGAAYGVLLKDISASQLRDNRFIGNTVGAFLEGTTRSRFEGNTFQGNGWALRVLGNTDSNTFTGNSFLANTFDVSTNAGTNLNRFERNYWDGYRGVDLDRDGIGDDAYRPVRLSSLLIERNGVASLLLHSFFFAVLDQAEHAIPALTPETYRDDAPLMAPPPGARR